MPRGCRFQNHRCPPAFRWPRGSSLFLSQDRGHNKPSTVRFRCTGERFCGGERVAHDIGAKNVVQSNRVTRGWDIRCRYLVDALNCAHDLAELTSHMLDLVGGERDPSEVREVRDLLGSNVRHPAPMGWGMSPFYRGGRGGRNGSRGEGGPNTKRNANAFDDGFAVGGIPYRVGSASAPSKPSAAGPSLTSTAN